MLPNVTARYQIHLFFNGNAYVADVSELEGCHGTGATYAEALASAEAAISAWVFDAINDGRRVPAPAKDFVLRPPTKPPADGPGAAVTLRLHRKFGNLNNRQLAEKIGVLDVNLGVFAGSIAGAGSREIRCAIAIALGEKPSTLWPGRSQTSADRDDFEFERLVASDHSMTV